ncbi:hypothetical protein BO82DRAFT_350509 [Aspergillus uvarum CBS 121591]|uniref:Molybdenum cofactor sulfurase middle domain-containing protein n=1 Tax=Aspergillus uvarum CBS 121591 TaxID=1448315 RepID=A0A319CM28_9EURO|nr:hypothetical protein BO82DRAFT_350509 [Aspergillus uvarum CBS 121591]PYH86254.1 hypothetical protein BO82DRAFT_350509 [Aspergillus uvarum CBS 121591]
MVTCSDHPWHSRNPSYIHEILEDGIVPFHSILALGCALTTHKQLYTSQEHVSHHTTRLTAHLYQLLSSLRHPNGVKVCEIYRDPAAEYGNSTTQGSIVAFNICSDEGRWLRLSHIEEAANEHRIHLRTGSVCNPGGLAKLLQLDEWELFQNYTAGVRCGCRSVLVGHKPSGIIRVSLGAMSTVNDVEHFVGFVHHLFGAGAFPLLVPTSPSNPPTSQHLHVHTLMIYPIHGAAAYTIPAHQSWHLTSTGLQWDRQWCLVNLQTGSALDQRHAPRLLLLQPMIDAVHGILRITVHHSLRRRNPKLRQSMTVPLHDPGRDVQVPKGNLYQCQATSLGKLHGPEDGTGLLRLFHSPDLVAFFTAALGVPCTMARFLDPADCISPAWRTLPEQQPMAEVHVSPSDQPLLSLPPEQTQTIPHEESQDGQPSRRSLPVALTETLRANALLASDTATAATPDNRQWCLLQFGPREQQAQASIVQFGRMKAVAITAERQSPEIFERTSPVVKIVWREGNEGTLSVRAGQPLVLRE